MQDIQRMLVLSPHFSQTVRKENYSFMKRREFLHRVAAASLGWAASAKAQTRENANPSWRIGCFNRPWARFSFKEALSGVKAAGYRTIGLLTRHKEEPIIGADASAGYVKDLGKRIHDSGLVANFGALRSKHDIPVDESIRQVRTQIDHAASLGLGYVMSFGVDSAAQYEHYYKVMADAAEFCAGRKIQLVLKPHGGGSGASEEILRCLKRVDHPNFKIWYDAGNIIHYTGKDPVAELEPVVRHVTGFCAKDCARIKGDVMIQFGTGAVDFRKVFATLKAASFQGPIMVECCAGNEYEEITANARRNREFLEKITDSL